MQLLGSRRTSFEREFLRPDVQHVRYSDGEEHVYRDRKGRVTRHTVMRVGRPYVDNCYRYERGDGRTIRVRITPEEWEEIQERKRLHTCVTDTERHTTGGTKGRGNAANVDENDENIL